MDDQRIRPDHLDRAPRLVRAPSGDELRRADIGEERHVRRAGAQGAVEPAGAAPLDRDALGANGEREAEMLGGLGEARVDGAGRSGPPVIDEIRIGARSARPRKRVRRSIASRSTSGSAACSKRTASKPVSARRPPRRGDRTMSRWSPLRAAMPPVSSPIRLVPSAAPFVAPHATDGPSNALRRFVAFRSVSGALSSSGAGTCYNLLKKFALRGIRARPRAGK